MPSESPGPPPGDQPDAIDAIGALAEPLRRRLYFLVAGSGTPVSRDDAARRASIARPLAAFHLDRLVVAGLLVADFQRPPGRTGPGAGRPAKRYRRAATDVAISLPDRRYALAAELFAAGLSRGPAGEDPAGGRADAVDAAARAHGVRLGARARIAAGRRPARRAIAHAGRTALGDTGFEPVEVPGGRGAPPRLELRNCPFDALVTGHRDLTCGMNLALLEGFVDGLMLDGATARLEPAADRCCVVVDLPRVRTRGSRSDPPVQG